MSEAGDPLAAEPTHAWLLISRGNNRQYAGNFGYSEDARSTYRYDSDVANHKRIAPGDIVILRGINRLIGFAVIETIEQEEGTKKRQRCPICATTSIKARKRSTDKKFRCVEGHQFANPTIAEDSCTIYTATFKGTFREALEDIPFEVLRKACPRFTDQGSMQRIAIEPLRPLIKSSAPAFFLPGEHVVPSAITTDELNPAYQPGSLDERELVLRQIRERRGQQHFREALFARYGAKCQISGCSLPELLEAAHIKPYRGEPDNHVENGLLLRADLHTLFDLNLLGIEPTSLTISLHPRLKDTDYGRFHGLRLIFKKGGPNHNALEIRWREFSMALSEIPSP